MQALSELREAGLGRVLFAAVTPLASIFGSGFLIIVPPPNGKAPTGIEPV